MIFMDAYDAYKKFLAIKLHFSNDKYDYFKYRGQVRVTRNSFETRNDKYHFHKLSKKPDLELFLACNIRENTDLWVGKLFDDECVNIFRDTKKKLQSLEYMFKNDMSQFDSLDEAFVVRNGDYPKILNMYNRGEIMTETMVILNATCRVFDYWDSTISDTILWPKTRQRLLKYTGFMTFDVDKYNELLKDLYD